FSLGEERNIAVMHVRVSDESSKSLQPNDISINRFRDFLLGKKRLGGAGPGFQSTAKFHVEGHERDQALPPFCRAIEALDFEEQATSTGNQIGSGGDHFMSAQNFVGQMLADEEVGDPATDGFFGRWGKFDQDVRRV